MSSNTNDHNPRTLSGLPIDPLYSPEQLAAGGHDTAQDLGNPGEFPFTRGAYPTMYRGRLWTRRQIAGFGHRPGHQRALPLPAGPRPDRPEHRLRSPHPHRVRLRPRTGRGRGGPPGRRHRHGCRHGASFSAASPWSRPACPSPSTIRPSCCWRCSCTTPSGGGRRGHRCAERCRTTR